MKYSHGQGTSKKMEASSMENPIIINKSRMLEILDDLATTNSMQVLRHELEELKHEITSTNGDKKGLRNIETNRDTFKISQSYLVKEIRQIQETKTIERGKYYLNRLKKSVSQKKTSKINDINLNRWKEYDNLITDSLWVLQRRDSTGGHSSWYWGNFIPQIPNQLMQRFTKKGEWVVDPFAGSGTTLLECQRLERNGLGVELQKDVVEKVKKVLEGRSSNTQMTLDYEKPLKTASRRNCITEIEVGDSMEFDFTRFLTMNGVDSAQLLIMHPPYHDIIKFSTSEKDLSNAKSTVAFLDLLGKVVDNTFPILDKGRYLAVVIGDKYSKGEWIPLGFYVMQEVLKRNYMLKSIIVKNFEETLGKRNQKDLWRYRALAGGFYIFKHEYILLFKKC